MRRAVVVGIVCSIPWAAAHAHIGPSVRENNRYVKLTLFGNRMRLLYTFYVGEVPGSQARRRMDADRDGAISETEARGFGDEIAAAVAANLELTVDGRRETIDWSTVDVGLGTPTVRAGAFSVDLVHWVCLPSPDRALAHEVVLFDHWKPPDPGESELRVEESPGVTVGRSRFGRDGPISQLRFKWAENRPPHPLDTAGLFVDLTVDPDVADVSVDPSCGGSGGAAASEPASGGRSWPLYAGIAAALLALAGIAARYYRNTNG